MKKTTIGDKMKKEKILTTKGIDCDWKKAISHLDQPEEKFIKLGGVVYYNIYTKKPFSGKNLEKLQSTNLQGGFCTFNQARKLGGKVIKGSKAVTKLSRMVMDGKEMEFRSYPVFHISQIEFNKEVK